MRLIIPTAFLLALVACGRGTPRSDGGRARLPGDLAGCWALFDRAGRPASDSLYFAPAFVRLDSIVNTHWPKRSSHAIWVATRLGAGRQALPEQGRFTGWEADTASADSVHVRFHTGFSGTEMVLPAVRADTLHGHATEHWDFGPPFDTDGGAVTAVRVSCGLSGLGR